MGLLGFLATSSTTLREPSSWLLDWFLGDKSSSGVRVTPSSALTLPVHYACIRNISEDCGKLPLITYERLGRGKKRAITHPLYRLLHNTPNPDMTSMSFRETVVQWTLSWGNGYAEIQRTGGGRVVALHPIHPSRVKIKVDDVVTYFVRNDDGTEVRFAADDILHIKGLGDGYVGYSVISMAAESLGLGLAQQKYASTYYANGTKLAGVLEFPGKMQPAAIENFRRTWRDLYGGAEKSGETAILENGMKWKEISTTAVDGQMLESRQFTIEEICRWFRMPPHKVQHLLRAHFNNIEQQSIEYVTDTLMPWLVRVEQEIARKLFMDDEKFFAEHLVQGLLRGDQAARASFYRERFNLGSLSPNDIRELENENPYEGGDEYFLQSNMATVKQIIEGETEAEPEPMNEDEPAMTTATTAEDAQAIVIAGPSVSQVELAFSETIASIIRRLSKKEAAATARQRKRPADTHEEWSRKFYAEHCEDVIENVAPAAWSMAQLLMGTELGPVIMAPLTDMLRGLYAKMAGDFCRMTEEAFAALLVAYPDIIAADIVRDVSMRVQYDKANR